MNLYVVYMYMYIIPQSLLLHYFTFVSVVSQVSWSSQDAQPTWDG